MRRAESTRLRLPLVGPGTSASLTLSLLPRGSPFPRPCALGSAPGARSPPGGSHRPPSPPACCASCCSPQYAWTAGWRPPTAASFPLSGDPRARAAELSWPRSSCTPRCWRCTRRFTACTMTCPANIKSATGGSSTSLRSRWMLCDQAWGSMLEVPGGSRLNLIGLGYFSSHSHTVVQDYSYFFFLRMDENYNLLPHGVNFQDAIFPDTQENRRMFSSLFQFSNCSQGQQLATFSSDWEVQ
nr:PREDICTED: uncharacterized protein LOC102265623 [Bos mutus]